MKQTANTRSMPPVVQPCRSSSFLAPLKEEQAFFLLASVYISFALLLKCFQFEGRFPTARHEIPRSVIDYVAHQLKLDAALFSEYDWEGRTITNHRTQIREHFAFREVACPDCPMTNIQPERPSQGTCRILHHIRWEYLCWLL